MGEVPFLLTAYERKDRAMRIYTRVWDGTNYRDRRFLCEGIRTPRGAIDPEKENAARSLAMDRQRQMQDASVPMEYAGPLTLERGFARRLDPIEGEWATVTPHVRQVIRASKQILEILRPETRWEDLRHAHYRKLWRTLANGYKATGKGGATWTARVVSILQATAQWLQREGYIEPGDGQPAARWLVAMRKDWQEIVGRPVPAPAKPRYTDAEIRALWAKLPDADPRLALALEIGAELRLGQVIRAMRSDVMAKGDEPLHAVRIHGKGRKEGALVVLDDQSRAVLRAAMEGGYLADMEAAFQREEIKDYPLFPGHKLGEKVPPNRTRVVTRTGMHQMWRRLEEMAGVPHMPGRAWYGVRRLQADKAEDVEPDARVLNSMGGWKRTATRERYQEEGRQDIAEKAAETRRKIRPSGVSETGVVPPKVAPESYPTAETRFNIDQGTD